MIKWLNVLALVLAFLENVVKAWPNDDPEKEEVSASLSQLREAYQGLLDVASSDPPGEPPNPENLRL